MFQKLLRRKHQAPGFLPIPNDESSDCEISGFERSKPGTFPSAISLVLINIGIAIMFGSLGFFAGRYTSQEKLDRGLPIPCGGVQSKLVWNTTFSRLPQEDHYMQWKALFPEKWGFVEHPTLAPEPSTLGVWHQLHCLQVVYHGYYAAATKINVSNSSNIKRSELPHHTEGCFDYLRQSILCNADTNVEPLVPELYGRDTAIPRVCRDIHKVIEWSENWKSPRSSSVIYEVPQGIMDLEAALFT